MLSRREWLGASLGAGATLALTPDLLRAIQQSAGKLIHRAIPSSGEKLPIIGVQFQNNTTQNPAALEEVLRALVANGGRFLDTAHQSVPGVEDLTARVVTGLGIQDKLFLGLRGNPPGPMPYIDAEGGPITTAQLESLFSRFQVKKLDLVQLPVHAYPDQWPVLEEAKKKGRIRYIAATTIVDGQYGEMEELMRTRPVDFIGVDYAINNRNVEERILPLALERKIGVIAYFPFGIGSLFKRVGETPLPEWAASFDATTWAQFFLKYVVSHPAVTLVRAGTTKAAHLLDNLAGGTGRLPDEGTRKRMAELIDAIPAPPPPGPPPQANPALQGAVELSPAILDRYAGEYQTAAGSRLTVRRDGPRLLMKPANNAEAPLIPRSETRFSDPRGPTIEFQVDGSGAVTGLVVEQGAKKTPAPRIR